MVADKSKKILIKNKALLLSLVALVSGGISLIVILSNPLGFYINLYLLYPFTVVVGLISLAMVYTGDKTSHKAGVTRFLWAVGFIIMVLGIILFIVNKPFITS